jgi:hypothetical protein
MRRFLQTVFLAFCALALGAAAYYFALRRSESATARPVATRQAEVNTDEVEARAEAAVRASVLNAIAALPNEVILDAVSLNVDEDEGDEQIITVRKTDRPEGKLAIVVADFPAQRRAWLRAWEGEIQTTKLTTLSIRTLDLVGDHGLDLVCTGMNERNEQTIDVFRRAKVKEGLSNEAVCSLAADTIVLQELDRSEAYQLGQTTGESWPILAFRRDRESQNILDQIQSTWAWDPRRGRYALDREESIPGAEVEKGMIGKVLSGSESDFEDFLFGAWVESAKGPLDPAARFILFDRRGGSITFFSADSQEIFRWNDSHSTRYGIYVGGQNESVPNLRRLMDIEMTGADTISVRVFEDLQMKVDAEDRWDGIYRKQPAASAASLAGRGRESKDEKAFIPSGTYRSADGSELSLSGRRFTLRGKEKAEGGGFVAYQLGKDMVVELSVLREDGSSAGRRTYRATLSESKTAKESARTLVLSPARTTINGLELLEEPDLVFQQRSD